MTDQPRFTIEPSVIGPNNRFTIWDNTTSRPVAPSAERENRLYSLCGLLNGLHEDREKMRTALEFYADYKTWKAYDPSWSNHCPAMSDGGDTAREALGVEA